MWVLETMRIEDSLMCYLHQVYLAPWTSITKQKLTFVEWIYDGTLNYVVKTSFIFIIKLLP